MQFSSWNQSAPGQASLYRPLSPEQRNLIGWPLPGHPFWTHGIVGAVAARYQLADSAISPYLEALPPSTATDAEAEAQVGAELGGDGEEAEEGGAPRRARSYSVTT